MEIEALIAQVAREIEGQNWTEQMLTGYEHNLISMAVRATVDLLGRASPPSSALDVSPP